MAEPLKKQKFWRLIQEKLDFKPISASIIHTMAKRPDLVDLFEHRIIPRRSAIDDFEADDFEAEEEDIISKKPHDRTADIALVNPAFAVWSRMRTTRGALRSKRLLE